MLALATVASSAFVAQSPLPLLRAVAPAAAPAVMEGKWQELPIFDSKKPGAHTAPQHSTQAAPNRRFGNIQRG